MDITPEDRRAAMAYSRSKHPCTFESIHLVVQDDFLAGVKYVYEKLNKDGDTNKDLRDKGLAGKGKGVL